MQPPTGTYICERIIGSGGFATVYRARHRIAPVRVAIKLIDSDRVHSEADQSHLIREVTLLQHMDHPFIAKLFFVAGELSNLAVVQEFVPRGTLLDLVTKQGRINEIQIRYYCLQLVSVLDYLHSVRRVAHRDLKLENIMLDAYNNIKLIDFGLSRGFPDSESRYSTPCGSPPYIAPELITTGTYTQAADIWSLGIVLYALATGRMPFFDDDIGKLCRQIVAKPIVYPPSLSEDLRDLLKQMLCRNPSSRITIDQIKQHPWFPTEQYAAVMEASRAMLHNGEERLEIDEAVVATMASNGLDCTTLRQDLEAGEKNEMTVLYDVYVRQKQAEKMNHVLRMSALTNPVVHENKSLPPMKPQQPQEGCCGHQSHEWAGMRRRTAVGGRQRETPPKTARRRAPIVGMRPLDSIPRLVGESDITLSKDHGP
jgi:serine/threonine protein kinase